MRFLADENFPLPSVLRLRDAGYDVATTVPGTPDSSVLERAQAEGRLVITFDRDFGELIFYRGPGVISYGGTIASPGVIFLRFVPSDPTEPAAILERVLAAPSVTLDGYFTVVERDHVRQRALPEWRPLGQHDA